MHARVLSRLVVVALAIVVGGCRSEHHYRPRHPHPGATTTHPARPSAGTAQDSGTLTARGGTATIAWQRVRSPADVPPPPPPGSYRLHLIDVGTGLAILVQGHDFALLYDGGSNDRDEHPLRVVAYLAAALGSSGDDLCVAPGQPAPRARVPLAHVVLSHPHFDHASALDLVVHCYDVGDFWDAGRVNEAAFYRDLIAAIARAAATTYHTAADVPPDHAVDVKGTRARIAHWQRFSEGDTVALDAGARFTILHADGKRVPDPNQNSIVLALTLGGARVLLVGDAGSGERRDPSYGLGETEQFLVDHHAGELASDVLQVGHHGSKTSSRAAFVAAVHPQLALISSGPKVYGHTVLPDREIVDALQAGGARVIRTDTHDGGCPDVIRIGGDDGPGGCDTVVFTITPR